MLVLQIDKQEEIKNISRYLYIYYTSIILYNILYYIISVYYYLLVIYVYEYNK